MFVIGKFSDNGKNGWIACSEDGMNWNLTNKLATIFGMAHTMSVMQQTKMCITVFYKIPLSLGYFTESGGPKAKGD